MLALSVIAQGVYIVASLVVSTRLTIRTARIVRGGLCLYGLLVLGTVLFSVAVPAVLAAFGVDEDTIVRAFPEATGVMAVVLLGWVPAFAFTGLVRVAAVHSA